MEVFALVHNVKQRGGTYVNAHLELKSGLRGELPILDLPATKESETHLAPLRGEITRLSNLLQNAMAEREDLRMTAAQEKALRQRSDEQLAKAQQKIDELNQEIGMLRARLTVTNTNNGL
jgi:septal ring factor EnvC (AmiA/AmiB activator)